MSKSSLALIVALLAPTLAHAQTFPGDDAYIQGTCGGGTSSTSCAISPEPPTIAISWET